MLFCTREFLVFFVFIFTAYWALPRPWVRLGLLILSVVALGYLGRDYLPALRELTWSYQAVLGFLGSTSRWFWLSAMLSGALLLAWRSGPDRGRVWLLLGASFYFYACWNRQLALLIVATTLMDYLVARGMEALTVPRWRRLLLILSLCVNLSVLIYFKYANFFLQSLAEALHAAGASASLPLLQVILPIGISFYTFEAINYTVDVYRRRIPAERRLGQFMLFILFFPHLVAGPIVRARDFLPQIRRPKRWDWMRLHLGAQFWLMGLAKKMVIADQMAQFVEPVFKTPELYRTSAVWAAVIAYALQIYCDFSGYSDMALGSAYLLGYKLAPNFNMPYLATNFSEFWRRWHISLSSWLRDYLFIPLGGSRGRRWQTARNLLITMTLGGLWHGANWTFVAWGVLHGLLLVLHRIFGRFCEPRPRLTAVLQTRLGTCCRWAVTLVCVALCWIFFRAETFRGAATVFRRLWPGRLGLVSPLDLAVLACAVALVAACHAFGSSRWWLRIAWRLPAPAVGFSYALLLSLVLMLAPQRDQTFIYFQF